MEAHHIRSGTDGGVGLKPDDRFVVPLCAECHRELHNTGAITFERKYNIDLMAVAEQCQRQSPHLKKIKE
jgi:predicted HNH restriction endonuclease